MNCKINGILCKVDEHVSKSGDVTPCAYVFSGDETVCINGVVCNPDMIGKKISVDCDVKLREFEGRKYMTIRAANNE